MIRQPTPDDVSLRWWRTAIADPRTYRSDGDPQCGWYRMQRVKKGPWIPVQIFLIQEIDDATGELTEPERMSSLVDGLREDPNRYWTYLKPVLRGEYARIFSDRMMNFSPDRDNPANLSEKATGPK